MMMNQRDVESMVARAMMAIFEGADEQAKVGVVETIQEGLTQDLKEEILGVLQEKIKSSLPGENKKFLIKALLAFKRGDLVPFDSGCSNLMVDANDPVGKADPSRPCSIGTADGVAQGTRSCFDEIRSDRSRALVSAGAVIDELGGD